jgi:hypothetical protein
MLQTLQCPDTVTVLQDVVQKVEKARYCHFLLFDIFNNPPRNDVHFLLSGAISDISYLIYRSHCVYIRRRVQDRAGRGGFKTKAAPPGNLSRFWVKPQQVLGKTSAGFE